MRRFYLERAAISGDFLEILGPEARHISTVLRLRPGQQVEFFDASGRLYATRLEETANDRVRAAILATWQEERPDPSPLTLAQCLLKGQKMDFLIQKATELGVDAFLPVISQRCENHGHRGRQEERWQRIMIEACKQCRRTVPMRIAPASELELMDFSSFRHRLAAWETSSLPLAPDLFTAQSGPICLFLGPEGGLAPVDLTVLRREGFSDFSLGPRILRGETAALAAVAILRYLSGGMQPSG